MCTEMPPREYAEVMKGVRRVLSGHIGDTVAAVTAEMQRAADRLREMFLNFKALRSKKA